MSRSRPHTEQEEQHFTELALRLIDLVDAKTRTIVADKIAGYPTAPAAVRHRLLKDHISSDAAAAEPVAPRSRRQRRADELSELFFAANAEERRLILLNLPYALLPQAEPIAPAIARESTHRLEAAALGHNSELFARELERIARDLARAGAPADTRTSSASRSWWRPWRSACRRRCCSESCCASVRRSASRCSGSMSLPCCTRRSSPRRRCA